MSIILSAIVLIALGLALFASVLRRDLQWRLLCVHTGAAMAGAFGLAGLTRWLLGDVAASSAWLLLVAGYAGATAALAFLQLAPEPATAPVTADG